MELKLLLDMHLHPILLCVNCTLWNWNNSIIFIFSLSNRVNCTLWNWNKETRWAISQIMCVNCTLWNWNIIREAAWKWYTTVLIVPYGIETHLQSRNGLMNTVLIVPYGIETLIAYWFVVMCSSVNCTLWNWNTWIWVILNHLNGVNCTLWNWNSCFK